MPQQFRDMIAQIRLAHWLKNFLILLPCLMRFDSVPWSMVFFGFMAFGFSASFGYLVNDICDLKADRIHPAKMKRPYARGAFSKKFMFELMAGALALAAIFSIQTRGPFILIVAAYLIGTTAYALVLKKIPILDVVWVAGLMTLRLWAGAVIADVSLAPALVLFFFLSFVGFTFQKRRINARYDSEASAGSSRLSIRRLNACVNIFWVLGLLSASYFIIVDAAATGFSKPTFLFVTLAIYVAWFARVKRISSQDSFSKDLIDFCATDFVSWLCFFLLLGFATLAI